LTIFRDTYPKIKSKRLSLLLTLIF